MTKTCTPIIYSQTLTGSDDEVQIGDDDVGEKGSTDDEPDDSTLASVKKIRRSLYGGNDNAIAKTSQHAREECPCA